MFGPAEPNDAAMFDIDDTLIWTNGEPNVPIIRLLHKMKALGYKIVIITARPGFEIAVNATRRQLAKHGIVYDYLGFTSAETKTLMKRRLGYNFVLSVLITKGMTTNEFVFCLRCIAHRAFHTC